jgi:hypothetical protein
VESQALADRQAQMAAALTQQWQDFTPVTVDERVDEWETWLARDPAVPDGGETFADRVARFEEQVRQRDEMLGVA